MGDVLHSRVARSNLWGLTLAGARVVLCGPPTLLPQEFLRGDHRKDGHPLASVAVENAQTAYDRVSWAPNITQLGQARELHLATIELEEAAGPRAMTLPSPPVSDAQLLPLVCR